MPPVPFPSRTWRAALGKVSSTRSPIARPLAVLTMYAPNATDHLGREIYSPSSLGCPQLPCQATDASGIIARQSTHARRQVACQTCQCSLRTPGLRRWMFHGSKGRQKTTACPVEWHGNLPNVHSGVHLSCTPGLGASNG